MDRHPYRPAHVHVSLHFTPSVRLADRSNPQFWVEAKDHKTLITQVFNSDSDYLADDAVFAVKDRLVVEYKPIPKDYQAPADLEGKMKYELEVNLHLQKAEVKGDAQVESSVGLAIAQNAKA